MKRTMIFYVALILLLAGCTGSTDGAATPEEEPSGSRSTQNAETAAASDLRTVTIDSSGGETVEVRVEIADDATEHARGLMERTALGEDRGMLFVFPSEETRSFWMRNTLIPLSIAYIDSEGRIIDLQDMKALDDEPPNYVSAEPAQYALEVNQGFFEERGVEVGDMAELPRQPRLDTPYTARRLFISEHTVQNHLRSVVEKTGVRSRRGLVKRLFFEGLYPSLFG